MPPDKPVEEDYVFTQRGRWGKKLAPEYIPTQQSASYITYQGMLWGVYRIEPSATLFNAWIIENTEKDIIYFYKNYKITAEKHKKLENMENEQVADIQFVSGDLQHLVYVVDFPQDK